MKEVIKLVLGALQTNTYILKEENHCIIIDPAGSYKRILNAVEGLTVDAICLTHGHFDHIQAVDKLVKELKCDVYISLEDECMLRDGQKNCSSLMGLPLVIQSKVKHYDTITKIGLFEFNVMEASGHTKGSVLLMIENIMFCGDVLFKEGIGRCDLYGGSFSQMKATLNEIMKINTDYILYSGHGEDSTLFEEFKNNPYLN